MIRFDLLPMVARRTLGRIGALRQMRSAIGDTPLDGRMVAQAWEEIQSHPRLTWVPPLWRSEDTPTPAATLLGHAISALERNLVVDVRPDKDHGLAVVLSTGPLVDRPLADGIDPVNPSGTIDPKLTVTAPSFEIAVIRLRDVLRQEYGPAERAPGDQQPNRKQRQQARTA